MFRALLFSFRDLIYPPICLHCFQPTESGSSHLCRCCLEVLTMIDAAERCPDCFSFEGSALGNVCAECRLKPSLFAGRAAAFDYIGPAASLLRQFKYGNQIYLATGLAAFMVAQFAALQWPMPDYIVPMPITFMHRLERGYNQSLLLAEGVAKMLGCPWVQAIKRKSGEYSQAGLGRKQRMELTAASFSLVAGKLPLESTVLLIDDVMTTGSTLSCCAEILQEACPKTIYALTFCRAL